MRIQTREYLYAILIRLINLHPAPLLTALIILFGRQEYMYIKLITNYILVCVLTQPTTDPTFVITLILLYLHYAINLSEQDENAKLFTDNQHFILTTKHPGNNFS